MELQEVFNSLTAFHIHERKVYNFTAGDCAFGYRESIFKHLDHPLLWKTTLSVPSRAAKEIESDINTLLKKRSIAQPFTRTAGSCFKAMNGTPAWKIIDAAGLKGAKVGDLQVSDKHANFLINTGNGTYDDAKSLVTEIREKTGSPLELEMRFIEESGALLQ